MNNNNNNCPDEGIQAESSTEYDQGILRCEVFM
jgi:hypothetical protein